MLTEKEVQKKLRELTKESLVPLMTRFFNLFEKFKEIQYSNPEEALKIEIQIQELYDFFREENNKKFINKMMKDEPGHQLKWSYREPKKSTEDEY